MPATPECPDFKQLLAPGGLPELGPGPRAGVFSEAALGQALDPLLRAAELSATSRELVRGIFLLWHDHLDAAHVIGQGIESADGSFLHGMMHRREPDYGNAAYWFRRVRGHAGFPKIAKRAGELLKASNDRALAADLVPEGVWDAFAFIRRCEEAAGKSAANPQVGLLCRIQAIETEVLLEHLLEC
jgi:hypothetical protein